MAMSLDMLASYLPSPVLRRFASDRVPPEVSVRPEVEVFPAAALFADISGFTPLAARLARRGATGAEQLSRILDDYFGRLLTLIADHGGDAIKFAGDALLALWPAPGGDLAAAVARAARCGLAAQAALESYDAGEGDRLQLYVAIGAGEAFALHVGGVADRWHFLVAGAPIAQIGAAKDRARAGEVVLSAQAWALIPGARGEPCGDGCVRLIGGVATGPDRAGGPGGPGGQGGPGGPGGQDAPRPASRAVSPQALRRMEAYVPAPVRTRLAVGHGDWLAELRRVSVLFLQPRLDLSSPELALERAQAVMQRAQPVFERYGGLIKELVVDDKGVALVGIFGLPPQAHEDDAARCVGAALALREALEAAGIATAIGVTTGRAFCGAVGSPVRREYTVVGDVMNMAARLMGQAAGTILCDEATRQGAQARFELAPRPALQVKGRAEPLAVWVPLAERRALPSGAILVGRARERAVVAGALAELRAGHSGAIVIEGEPGIGKTRLCEDARRCARELGLATLDGAGVAVESTTPYHAWRDLLATVLGVAGVTDAAERQRRALDVLGPARAARAPLLDAVVPLGLADNEVTQELGGQLRTAATRDLVLELVAEVAARTPLVVLLEDVHWLDGASWALLQEAGRRVHPLVLVLTTRPSEQAAAELAAVLARATTHRIALEPLPGAEALELVCRRLGVAALPPAVAALIRDKAGGHPLFAEELALTLRDAGLIDVVDGECRLAPDVDLGAVRFPDTVQGAITSRIDRLSPQEQLTLKVASVIGGAFTARVLREVHPIAADRAQLRDHLGALHRLDFTVLERPEPELTYSFKHMITREVAYDLMLFAQRRELHRAVASWYERDPDADLAPVYATLAHHWAQADRRDRAVDYLDKAAERTFSLGLAKQSVELGLQAARLLDVQLPAAPDKIGPLIAAEMAEIERLRAGRRPAELADLPRLTDARVARVIALFSRIGPLAHQSLQPELFALMTLRRMSLTLAHGNGDFAPDVYAMYAVVYRAMTGDSPTASEFSELALDLNERQGGALTAPVSFMHAWFVDHWVNPVASGLTTMLAGAEAGFRHGDVLFGCFNLSGYVVHLAVCGTPLDEVARVAAAHLAQNGGRVRNAAFHCVHELMNARALAGRTRDPLGFTDDEHDEAREIASILDTDQYNQIAYYHISKLRLCYHHEEYAAALGWADAAVPLLGSFAGQVGESELVFFHALALLARAAEVDVADADRAALVARAEAGRAQLAAWSQRCPANFEHKRLLVEAEAARLRGAGDEAILGYDQAAASAHEAGYVQHVALAHELAARHLAALGRPADARAARDRARAAYARWGAHAKVRRLEALQA